MRCEIVSDGRRCRMAEGRHTFAVVEESQLSSSVREQLLPEQHLDNHIFAGQGA